MANSSITIINPAASNAQMTAATATNVVVTPGTMKDHPGVAKAWCRFNGSTAGTNAPLAGYNVTSITRNGLGDYTIILTIPFFSGNWSFTAWCQQSSGAASYNWIGTHTITSGTIRLIFSNSAGSPTDMSAVGFAGFGYQ